MDIQGVKASADVTNDITAQAESVEATLPRLLRTLFTLEQGHPLAELPLAQFRVCMVLFTGSKSMSQLSEELGISVSAITQISDRLEKIGMVHRSCDSEDRRTKILCLTEYGQNLMSSRRQFRIERVSQALSHLNPEQRQQFVDVLKFMLEAAIQAGPVVVKDELDGVRTRNL